MINWRRTYFCTMDHWTGEWYQRHQLVGHEILFARHRRIGVGWRGPAIDMRTSDVRDLLR